MKGIVGRRRDGKQRRGRDGRVRAGVRRSLPQRSQQIRAGSSGDARQAGSSRGHPRGQERDDPTEFCMWLHLRISPARRG